LGYVNGNGASAQFNWPYGVACDAQGNVYVAELSTCVIRKITPGGDVSTFAGTGTQGYTNGPGTVAQFNAPSGVACDAQGNVYVADQGQHLIRKITPSGVVSTLAGSTTGGADDGTGTAAKFYAPYAVACDAQGNVYVSDRLNYRIRKITQAGVVTTLAGSSRGYADGAGSMAKFEDLRSIACDAQGNLFVADDGNHKIRKITPAGVVTTYAGSVNGYANGDGTVAQFNSPYAVAVDHNTVYVADYLNSRIRKIVLQ
jgi:streptogramin lyase